jgi:hypothetical protein
MDDIALYTVLKLLNLAALYEDLEEPENGSEQQSSQARLVPHLSRPSVDYEHHVFHLNDLSDVEIWEFTRYGSLQML